MSIYTCNNCQPVKKFALEQGFLDHRRNKHGPITCGLSDCVLRFNTLAERNRHRSVVHSLVKTTGGQSATQPFSCGSPGCGAKFNTLMALKQHTIAVHSAPAPILFACGFPKCGVKFTTHEGLRRHGVTAHPPSPKPALKCRTAGATLLCPRAGCGQIFSTPTALGQHSEAKHQDGMYHMSLLFQTPSLPPFREANSLNETPIRDRWEYFDRTSEGSDASASPSPTSPPSSASSWTSSLHSQQSNNTHSGSLGVSDRTHRQYMPILSGTRVYKRTTSLLVGQVEAHYSRGSNSSALPKLREYVEQIQPLDIVSSLVESSLFRRQLIEVAEIIGLHDSPDLWKALNNDGDDMVYLVRLVLTSDQLEKQALELRDDRAQHFMDILRTVRNDSDDVLFHNQVYRLIQKLSIACHSLPDGLFINGTHTVDKENQLQGGFADIFKAINDGRAVALKRLRRTQATQHDLKDQAILYREALLFENLKHPYVLPFLGMDCETFPAYFPCIVTPWMRNGTILEHIQKSVPSRECIHRLTLEVIQGLGYLHASNVIHGDLRGSNILIDDEWHVRLADFGLANFADATLATDSSNHHGAKRWMAPELLDPQLYPLSRFQRTRKSDVYSLACVFLELYTSKHPFSDVSSEWAVVLKVIEEGRPERPPAETITDGVWSIMELCWAQSSSCRPDIPEILRLMKVINSGGISGRSAM